MSGRKDRNDAKRVVQQQLQQERRRRRNLITSAVAVAVLLAGGLLGWGLLGAQRKGVADSTATPGVAVDAGTGFAVGTGGVKVDVYEDFMCPVCGRLEQQSGPLLAQLAAAGKATVVYHPIAILDRYSTTRYSTRAAGAAAAAAQGGKFAEFHNALFARQPEEGSAGLSDDTLAELGRSVGLGDAFVSSVKNGSYRGWAATVTDTASSRGITGTPVVLVAGKTVDDPVGHPESLAAALAAASR